MALRYLGILICLLFPTRVWAAEGAWEIIFHKNPEPSCVGYKVYASAFSGGPYKEVASCTNLVVQEDGFLHCIVNTPHTTQYMVLTAYAENYEQMSDYSVEIRAQGLRYTPSKRCSAVSM